MLFYLLLFIINSYINCHFLQLSEGQPCSWDDVEGQCAPIYRCLSAIGNIENKVYPPMCNYINKLPIVCCTDCKLVKDTRLLLFNQDLGILERTGTNKAKDRCLEYIHILDYPCKANSEVKYYNGLNTKNNCIEVMVKKINDEKPHYNVEKTFDEYSYDNFESNFANGNGIVMSSYREEMPHIALLGYGDHLESAEWACGGSIISERFILTAGHCLASTVISRNLRGEFFNIYFDVRNNEEDFYEYLSMSKETFDYICNGIGPVKYIAVGIMKRTDPPELWQRFDVKKAIKHPEYDPKSKYHDIALLLTHKEIKFNGRVRPACLHVDKKYDQVAYAVGWSSRHKQHYSESLQSIALTRFSKETCKAYFPRQPFLKYGYNHTIQMCYGDKLEPTCEDDSGGPLQSQDHEQCVYTILGVSSYGRKCIASRGSFGLYTRVSFYVPWIEGIVWA